MTNRFPSEKELKQALNQLSEEDTAKIRADLEKDEIESQKHEVELQKHLEQTTQEIIDRIPTVYAGYIAKKTNNHIEVEASACLDNSLGFTTVYEQATQKIYDRLSLDIGSLPKCWKVNTCFVDYKVADKVGLDDKLVYEITLTNKNNNYQVLFRFDLTSSLFEILANLAMLIKDK